MRATEDVLAVWRKFDEFPMETLTKAWHLLTTTGPKQRTVEQMKLHREQYGTSGNCFDLAIWLLHEFRKEKVTAYPVLTPDDHVAVVALNEYGNRYLCDLGDQWIEPILIEPSSDEYTEEYLSSFFPGALVKVETETNVDRLVVTYQRPNGKEIKQTYLLSPVTDEQLLVEAEKTQGTLWQALVEKRMFNADEVVHWEFDDDISFISSMQGKKMESKLHTLEEWAARIAKVSGMNKSLVEHALEIYAKKSS